MTRAATLIETAAELDGPLNMAVDEVLWQTAAGGPVFFRVYGWAGGPAISLGYFQHAASVRAEPRWRGVPYVRRVTGGGAIVHDGDLTYSLALPASLAPPTHDLYRLLHQAVADALRSLGVPATVQGVAGAGGDGPLLCFRRRDPFAVCSGPHKLLGSAARRRHQAVLVQGSLAVRASPLAPELAGLAEITGRPPDRAVLAAALRSAAASALGLEFRPAPLPDRLGRSAVALADARYRSPAWNNRR
jgi:lipoate-protein ligase A